MTESLIIRIVADASHAEREIDNVARRVADLQTRFTELAEAGRSVSTLAGSIASLAGPLQGIGTLVARVSAQVRALSRAPVTLNVAPAVAALARLAQMIQLVGGQLARLNSIGGGLPGMLPPPLRMAQGGLVRGPGGIDRVPALLTAGEFVLRKPAVERLGAAFLEALNRLPSRSAAFRAVSSPAAPVSAGSTTHVSHFGGININVSRGEDVHEIVRDLRLHAMRLRNRRG